MAYEPPTVADFKARFASFGPLGDPNDLRVQAALEGAHTVADFKARFASFGPEGDPDDLRVRAALEDAATVADFKERFASFGPQGYSNDLRIQAALEDAATVADATWSDADRRQAVMLKAAHELTLDGVGTGTEAELASTGLLGFSSIRSGALSLDRGQSASATSFDPNGYSLTVYGRRLQALIRSRFIGVLAV